jgi:hypothetical protein
MYYDNDSLDKTTDHQNSCIASPVNKEYQALQGNINTLTFNLDDLWLSQNVSLMYNRWVIANQVNKEYHGNYSSVIHEADILWIPKVIQVKG